MLTVSDLRKSFNHTTAVEGITFTVRRGEIFGLLGPNGAGKTTTIRMILDILRPDGGRILFDGDTLLSGNAEPRGVPSRRARAVPQGETA